MFHPFQRLIAEVLRGETRRTLFQPWGVEVLVDIEGCGLEPKRRVGTLRQYVRAVERQTGPWSGSADEVIGIPTEAQAGAAAEGVVRPLSTAVTG
jgi:hypothetical protein